MDVGTKRIGVAMSDELGITAQGLETIIVEPGKNCFEEIKKIVREFNIKEIVVGLPLNMNGTKGEKADEVIKFVEELKKNIENPIKLWDERLTTMEAERMLLKSDISRNKRKNVKDMLAAQLILQNYLTYRTDKNV